jgi:hypothetical protein
VIQLPRLQAAACAAALVAIVGCAAPRSLLLAPNDPAPSVAGSGPSVDLDYSAAPAVNIARQEPASALHGLYFFVGGGSSNFGASGPQNATFNGTVDDTDSVFEAGVGFAVLDFLALEAGYCDPGKLTYDGTSSGGDITGSIDVDGFEVAAVGRYPLGPSVDAEARLGAFFWDGTETEHQDDGKGGITDSSSDDDGVDLLYGLGLRAGLTPNIGGRIEWVHVADVGADGLDSFIVQIIYSL